MFGDVIRTDCGFLSRWRVGLALQSQRKHYACSFLWLHSERTSTSQALARTGSDEERWLGPEGASALSDGEHTIGSMLCFYMLGASRGLKSPSNSTKSQSSCSRSQTRFGYLR